MNRIKKIKTKKIISLLLSGAMVWNCNTISFATELSGEKTEMSRNQVVPITEKIEGIEEVSQINEETQLFEMESIQEMPDPLDEMEQKTTEKIEENGLKEEEPQIENNAAFRPLAEETELQRVYREFAQKIEEAKAISEDENKFPGAYKLLQDDIAFAEKGLKDNKDKLDDLKRAYQTLQIAITAYNDSSYTPSEDIVRQIQEKDPQEVVLQEGTIRAEVLHYFEYNSGNKSMADSAIVKPIRIFKTNKGYQLNITMKSLNLMGSKGYLGKLRMQNGGTEGQETFEELQPISTYNVWDSYNNSETGTDRLMKGTAYPKEFIMPVSKDREYEIVQVYVPIMGSFGESVGTQKARLKLDWSEIQIQEVDKSPLTEKVKEAKAVPIGKKKKEAFDKLQEAILTAEKRVGEVSTEAEVKEEVRKLQEAMDEFVRSEDETSNEAAEHIRYVKLNVEDGGVAEPQVRRMLDNYGELVRKSGKMYLRLTYFSVQRDSRRYNRGSEILQYSYEEAQDEKDRIELTDKKVLERGKIGGEYELSQVDIPVEDKDKVYLYGQFTTLNIEDAPKWEKFGIVRWEHTDKKMDSSLEEIKVLTVEQGPMTVKDRHEDRLPFDIEKEGILYSPYSSKDGKKFKLNDGKYSLEINVKRTSFLFNELRHIKFTLDGTEPSFESEDADLSFSNKDFFLPDKYYRFYIDPLTIDSFPKDGGDLNVKIKGYNADGSKSTKTVELVIPFEEQTIDEIEMKHEIENTNFVLGADTYFKHGFYRGATMSVAELKEEDIVKSIEKMVEKEGANNPVVVKIDLLDKNGNPNELAYPKGWNSGYPPVRLLIKDKTNTVKPENLIVYEYQFGEIKQISAKKDYQKKALAVNINQSQGYYVIADKEYSAQLKEAKIKLQERLEEGKKFAEGTSVDAIELRNLMELAQKELNKSRPNAGNLMSYVNRIDRVLLKIQSGEGNISEFDRERARALLDISKQDVLMQLFEDEYGQKIKAIVQELETEYQNQNSVKLVQATQELKKLLQEPQYKYPTRKANIMIWKHREDTPSMANNVFEQNALLVEADDKNYLVVDLKVFTFGPIRGHLLNFSVFKGELDYSDKYRVYSLNKMEDIGMNGKQTLFDGKILVELENPTKDIYYVRVDNDAMNGANPAARLKIEKGELISKPKPPEEKSFELKLEGEKIRVTPEKSRFKKGERVTITLEPNEDEVVSLFHVNGEDRKAMLQNNEYSFEISEDTTVRVEYEKKVSSNTGGGEKQKNEDRSGDTKEKRSSREKKSFEQENVKITNDQKSKPSSNLEGSSYKSKVTGEEKKERRSAVKTKFKLNSPTMTKIVDGVSKEVAVDTRIFVEKGRAMIPLKYVAESLGFEVKWDNATKRVLMQEKRSNRKVIVSKNQIKIGDTVYVLNSSLIVRNGRTYLSVNNIAKVLGLKMGQDILWDNDTKELIVNREMN